MLARATCPACALAAGAILFSTWSARADVPAAPIAATAAPASAPRTVGPVTIAAAAGPLSLEDAVKLTLTRNERAKISDLNVVVADAAVEKARAGFLPLVTIGGQDTQHAYTASNNNAGTAQAIINQPIVNASLFPLYSQAKALAEAQRSQNVDDKRLLSFTAATAFFQVLDAQDVVTAAQRQLENSQANLNNTQARAQSGLSSTNDVTRAQVDMSAASREVEVDKGILDNAYVQLALIANAPIPSTVVAPTATLAAARKPAEPADSLVRAAIDRRPDVQVAKYQMNAAHDFADEPLLRLVPTLGVQGEAQVGTALPGGRWNDETVQATLTWTLFDQGVRYADKHSRDAQADIADLNVRLLGRTVDAQVRSAAALLTSAQAAFKVADDSVKFARQNVDETAILYRQGLAKAIELIDANDSRFAAEVNYATAEFAMAQAYLGLRQALGLEPLGGELK